MEETRLIRRSIEGDGEAFGLLMTPYQSLLARSAYLLTGNADVAQDVVQETLIEVWKGLPSYQHRDRFRAWLLTVLVNQARRQYRKKRIDTTSLTEETVRSKEPEVETVLLQKEQDQQMTEMLGMLPADHRDVLVLRYFSQLTVPEIAKVMRCPEGTVKSRLHRALEHLAHLISTHMPSMRGNL